MPNKKQDTARREFSNSLIGVLQAAMRLDCSTHELNWVNGNLDSVGRLINDLQKATATAQEAFQRYRDSVQK